MTNQPTLHEEVRRHVGRGYQVWSQTGRSAQLVRRKRFSLLMCVLLLGVFYIPYYIVKRDETISLYVDAFGIVQQTAVGGSPILSLVRAIRRRL